MIQIVKRFQKRIQLRMLYVFGKATRGRLWLEIDLQLVFETENTQNQLELEFELLE